jgi:hypothetical protein
VTELDQDSELTALLDADEERELAAALKAAFDPEPLAPERHAELLALALEDPFAPPDADELRESERLRVALEQGDETHPDAALARALRSALRPEALPDGVPRALLPADEPAQGRGSVVYASFGALALAAAAAFGFLLTRPEPASLAVSAAKVAAPARSFARSRTTGELFDAPFAANGATERIDRIASSRARELRENRYLAWGLP